MHEQAMDYVARWRTSEDLCVLDIGGRNINGSLRDLFPNAVYVALDIEDAPDVDIVADARTWEPDARYDLVLCTEVFEHVEDWHAILATAVKALAPGGRLIVTCAGEGRFPHSGRREAPAPDPDEWYRNLTIDELAAALRGYPLLVDISVEALGDDLRATAVLSAAEYDQHHIDHDPYTGKAVE
jgi:SAM-dependent methyltransferase